MLKIEFRWSRDSRGYLLVESAPKNAAPPPNLYSTFTPAASGVVHLPASLTEQPVPDPGQRVVRNGGEDKPYFPLKDYGLLFPVFVKDAVNPAGVLTFIEKFGPLTIDGMNPRIGERVVFALNNAKSMRLLLDAYRSNDSTRLSRAISDGMSMEDTERARLRFGLAMDRVTQQATLSFIVPDLIGALWLQLFQTIAGGRQIQSCMECGDFFEVGAGSPRRLDAKFCSDNHRVKYNSRKRSEV